MAGGLLWALSRDLGVDGFRVDAASLRADYGAACAAHSALACELATGAVPRDEAGRLGWVDVRERARELCAQSDGQACLVAAMLTLRTPFGGFREDAAAEDQRDARTVFARGCDGGVPRACTELGFAYRTGAWSYLSDAWAARSFRDACRDGELEGCRQLALLGERKNTTDGATKWFPSREQLRAAAEKGHVEAWADLARLDDDAALAARACDGGSARGCRLAGRAGDACRLGDPDACITDLLEGALRDGTDILAVRDTLQSLCSTNDRACREADFLMDGSPIVPTEPGFYADPLLVERYLLDVEPKLRRCHVSALHANPEASGTLTAWLRILEDGHVGGVFVPDAFDRGLGACTERALLGLPLRRPLLGPMLARVTLPFRARTTVTVRPVFLADDDGVIPRLAPIFAERGAAMDRCVTTFDDARYTEGAIARAFLLPGGRVGRFSWDDGDLAPEALACLEGVISAPTGVDTTSPREFTVALTFLDELPIPIGDAVVTPLPPRVPDKLRLLAVVADTADLEGKLVASGGTARVAAQHAEVARRIAGFTNGGLVVETEVLSLPVQLVGATMDRADPEQTRLRYEATDVPSSVWSTLPAGRYDGVVFWVPTPPGTWADVGTTSRAATLRGAAFSALPLPQGREPRPEALLHAIWSQYVARAAGQLGVTLPEPERILEADGLQLDPRFWIEDPGSGAEESGLRELTAAERGFDESGRPKEALGHRTGDVSAFYAHVFGKELHPAMRDDLRRLADGDAPSPANVGPLALPIRDSAARNLEVLADGRRGTFPPPDAPGPPTFRDRAWIPADAAPEDAWFGLAWADPVSVRTIRARLGSDPKGPATVAKVVVEGRVGGDEAPWQPIATVVPETADLVVRMPAAGAIDGLRVRVLEFLPDQRAECLELEAE